VFEAGGTRARLEPRRAAIVFVLFHVAHHDAPQSICNTGREYMLRRAPRQRTQIVRVAFVKTLCWLM
jgi:hypothetical protein